MKHVIKLEKEVKCCSWTTLWLFFRFCFHFVKFEILNVNFVLSAIKILTTDTDFKIIDVLSMNLNFDFSFTNNYDQSKFNWSILFYVLQLLFHLIITFNMIFTCSLIILISIHFCIKTNSSSVYPRSSMYFLTSGLQRSRKINLLFSCLFWLLS